MSNETDDMEQDAAFALAEMHRLRTALQQAERERDDARRDKRDMGAIISNTLDALEGEPGDSIVGLATARVGDLRRAEAANAELRISLESIIAAGERISEMRADGRSAPDISIAVIRDDLERHGMVGAALLERLRALERVANLLIRSGVNSRWVEGEEQIDLCLMAARALKGETCDECGMVGAHKLQCGRRA